MKVYILMQIIESDGIRDFNVIMITSNRDKAIKELNRLVELDSTQDFKFNGFDIEEETHCKSNYEDGFTEYIVIEKELEE